MNIRALPWPWHLTSSLFACTAPATMPSLAVGPGSRTTLVRCLAALLTLLAVLGLPTVAAQAAEDNSGGLVSAAPTLNVSVGLLGADNWPFSGYQQGASGQLELQGFEARALGGLLLGSECVCAAVRRRRQLEGIAPVG